MSIPNSTITQLTALQPGHELTAGDLTRLTEVLKELDSWKGRFRGLEADFAGAERHIASVSAVKAELERDLKGTEMTLQDVISERDRLARAVHGTEHRQCRTPGGCWCNPVAELDLPDLEADHPTPGGFSPSELMETAAELVTVDDSAPEYDRGIRELVAGMLGLAQEDKPSLERILRAMARGI